MQYCVDDQMIIQGLGLAEDQICSVHFLTDKIISEQCQSLLPRMYKIECHVDKLNTVLSSTCHQVVTPI